MEINSVEAKPVINLAPSSSNLSNHTILELVSKLRAAYRKAEFDEVECALLIREERLLKEQKILEETLGKKYGDLEKKINVVASEKLELESQVMKCRRECEEIREKLTRANEDLLRANTDLRVVSDREKRARERNDKIYSDLEMEKTEKKELVAQMNVLNGKISELKDEKSKAEDSANWWKKSYEKCEPRVRKLEEDIAMLASVDGVVAKMIEEETPGLGLGSKRTSAIGSLTKEVNPVANGNSELVYSQNQRNLSNYDEKINASPGAGSSKNSPVNDINVSQGTAVDGNSKFVNSQNLRILSNCSGKIDASHGAGSSTNSAVNDTNVSQRKGNARNQEVFESGFSNKSAYSSRAHVNQEIIEIDDSDNELPTRDGPSSAAKTGKDVGSHFKRKTSAPRDVHYRNGSTQDGKRRTKPILKQVRFK